MSSLSTLPKGDSAWLLRKAIERIIQQISVLETNIGSSTTGNSANTQIIFNDNGVLRGDTGLVYNKATDLLSFGAGLCYGLLTSASATITGALTVGADITSTSGKFATTASGQTVGLQLDSFVSGGTFNNYILNNNSSAGTIAALNFGRLTSLLYGFIRTNNNSENLQLGTSGTGSVEFFQNNSTAMTLNSTGLGIGASPTAKLDVNGTVIIRDTFSLLMGFGNQQRILAGGTSDNTYLTFSQWTGAAYTERMRIDQSGNVGVGVTPTNKLTIGTGSFNSNTASGSASLYATVSQGLVILADGLVVGTRGGVNNFIADTSGNLISRLTTTAPTLSDNGYMVFNLTSNTNLRITVRCNDGTTRTADITLA
jgi:hypothetical protein